MARGLRGVLLFAALALAWSGPTWAGEPPASRISPHEAKDFVGQHKTVCGVVASAKYARRSRGKPTFLNLGKPYPSQVFTAVIWIGARKRFSYRPERKLARKRICVSGRISTYKRKAQIEVSGPSQIRLEE